MEEAARMVVVTLSLTVAAVLVLALVTRIAARRRNRDRFEDLSGNPLHGR